MIHHLARAFHVRETLLVDAASQSQSLPLSPAQNSSQSASNSPARSIKPRPLTPWRAPNRPANPTEGSTPTPEGHVRISTDPSDVRRTVMSGRFAAVCAALERLVREQEASAA